MPVVCCSGWSSELDRKLDPAFSPEIVSHWVTLAITNLQSNTKVPSEGLRDPLLFWRTRKHIYSINLTADLNRDNE